MGIDYTPVLGVGVDYDDVTFESLTEYAKCELIDNFNGSVYWERLEAKYYVDDVDHTDIPNDVFNEALEEYFYEVCWDDDFLYELGLTAKTGSYYSGVMYEVGVRVSLSDLDNVQQEVNKAKETFKKILNLEPCVFHGVLVS